LLLKINDAELAATLQRAAARRELALGREQRLRLLLRGGGSNQQDYDTALSELNVQEAEVRLIEAQLAKTEIRAPFDGIVGLRFVSEGSYVSPATRIATLQNLERMKLDFTVPEKHLARIGLGRTVLFTVAGGPQHFTGEIYAVEPRVDVATRTALLRAVCRNPDARLLPGAFASVEFTLAEVPDALLVPPVAVVPGLTEKNVFVAQGGQAVRRAVEIGVRTATTVQILAGLQPDDVVITSGIQSLRPGLPVEVMP
jgi:membrane fusion protein (multidrug efflux system)